MAQAHYGVDETSFIAAWNASATLAEVKQEMAEFAERTGNQPMTLPAILARASDLRNRGVALKRLKRATDAATDVNALNAFINQLRRRNHERF